MAPFFIIDFNTLKTTITKSYHSHQNNTFGLSSKNSYDVHIKSAHYSKRLTGNTKEETMIAPTLTYIMLAISGLLSSAIAWDDLRKAIRKPKTKKSCS